MKSEQSFWFGQTNLAPVAMFRLVFGLLTVNWFWQLFPDLTAFFTDEGIFPRSSQVAFFPLNFTLLNVAGDWWQVALLWLLSVGAAACLAAGFHSRTAAVVTFVMLGSFSLRDPLIGDASDQVFRMSAFWLAFTAAGDRYSVDAWLRTRQGRGPSGWGWALPVRILELQFAWIYLATGLEKLGGDLWRNGLAVFYSLQLEHTFARPWAAPLARELGVSRIASWFTLGAELGFLPLAFVPYLRRFTRIIAVAAAAALQVAILLLMNVGNFPLVMLAGLIPFLPPRWVEAVADRLRIPDPRAEHDPPMEHQERADNMISPAGARSRTLVATALCLCAAVIFLSALPESLTRRRPEAIDRPLRYANVLESWNMFSPDPPTTDGWLHIPATLSDGTHLDLATGRAQDEGQLYADPLYSRWTKVTEAIASRDGIPYRLEYARMYCRTRNLHLRPGQASIVEFDVIYTERMVATPNENAPPLRAILLDSHRC